MNKYVRKGLTGLALVVGGGLIYGGSLWWNRPSYGPQLKTIDNSTLVLDKFSSIEKKYSDFIKKRMNAVQLDLMNFVDISGILYVDKLKQGRFGNNALVISAVEKLPSEEEFGIAIRNHYITELMACVNCLERIEQGKAKQGAGGCFRPFTDVPNPNKKTPRENIEELEKIIKEIEVFNLN